MGEENKNVFLNIAYKNVEARSAVLLHCMEQVKKNIFMTQMTPN